MQALTAPASWPARLACSAALLLAACAAPKDDGKPAGASLSSAIASVNPFQAPGKDKPLIDGLAPGAYQPSPLAIGEEKDLARERGQALGFVRQKDLETHLNGLRAKLVAASGVSHVPGRAMLRANSSFAASSTPDGNLYLSIGWLPYLDSDDELAAILAHELAHVLLKHHSADMVTDLQKRAQALQELGVGTKMAVQKSGVVASGDARWLVGVGAVVSVSDKVLMPVWSRKQEREADLLGIDLLVKAGYTPLAMTTMLEKQRQWEKQTQESDEAFEKRAAAVAQTDLGQALAMSFKRQMAQVSASHPETGERIDATADYIDRYYGEQAMRAPSTAAWDAVKARPAVRATTRSYDLSFSAAKLLQQGNAKEAYRYARLAVVEPVLNDAYPNWVLARSAQAVGQNAEATAALQRAIKSNEPVVEIYDALIEQLEARRDYAGALQWTDKAIAVFGDSESWWPTKIRLLRKAGRTQEATALALKCTVETPTIRQKCQEANGNAPPKAAAGTQPADRKTPAALQQLLQPFKKP